MCVYSIYLYRYDIHPCGDFIVDIDYPMISPVISSHDGIFFGNPGRGLHEVFFFQTKIE